MAIEAKDRQAGPSSGGSLLDITLAAAAPDKQTVSADGKPVQGLIDGVSIREVPTHTDERGSLVEIYDPRWGWHPAPMVFAHCFTIRPGFVKGWGPAPDARGPVLHPVRTYGARAVRSAAGFLDLRQGQQDFDVGSQSETGQYSGLRLARGAQCRKQRCRGDRSTYQALQSRGPGQVSAADRYGLDPLFIWSGTRLVILAERPRWRLGLPPSLPYDDLA
jgi:hypothetical protein